MTMIWRKIQAIAWADIYQALTDRSALLFNFASPLAISMIIGAAFGGGSNDVDVEAAKVGVLNLDTGSTQVEQAFGDIYTQVLVEAPPEELSDFIDGKTITDEKKARRQIGDGDLDVLVVVPEDFTANVITPDKGGTLRIYYNPGAGIPGDVARSIIDGMTTQLNNQNIALQVGIPYASEQAARNNQAVDAAVAYVRQASQQLREKEAITLNRVSIEGDVQEFNSLQYFGPGMAILFMTYALSNGAISILVDQRNWTMQRIWTTPSPRTVYLGGKMVGIYVTGIFQMLILMLAMIFAANVVFGSGVAVWGTDAIGIVLVLASVVAAGAGFALVIASFAKNPDQGGSISTLVLTISGLLGGAFLPVSDVPVLGQLSMLTLNRWGLDGFTTLSFDGGTVMDILPNVAVLLGMAVVFFTIALFQFGRRFRS
ncbi:MAG: ABC transporter permease [Chloroflexi bacterium]|nr:ABC transporter permease [Chloroflexota bacterium]